MLTPPRYVLSGGFWGSASCWFGKLDGPVRSSQPRDDVSAVLTGFGGRGGGASWIRYDVLVACPDSTVELPAGVGARGRTPEEERATEPGRSLSKAPLIL